MLSMIFACDEEGAIGKDGDLPWRQSSDLQFFKRTTLNKTVVMGRKTWDSIGRPLPGRKTAVVSRSHPDLPFDIDLLDGLGAIESRNYQDQIWICGGAEIYRQALPNCQELYLTIVKRQVEGDAFFPEFEDSFKLDEIIRDESEFQIRRYTRA